MKKLINCRLNESSWKIMEVSIYKTCTKLTNLINAFDQHASVSGLIMILTTVSILKLSKLIKMENLLDFT